ncbi:hypothetical protein [Halorarius litoreus]|uniref:hypothetical protein n=1 Tax=Halorarius litoreus TaxID=2962676 RepID=UPI0020CC222F|nr:hypothetical protein [Halorarius litoreus]
MGVGTNRGTSVADRPATATETDDELAQAIERHRPTLTCLGDVFRRPTAEPLATAVATLVLVVLAWQTYATAVTHGLLVGAAVLGTVALAYSIAVRCWAVQNEYVAVVLARRDLDAVERAE